jgi:hypothetical protein
MGEDVLLAVHPQHPVATHGPISLTACEHVAWATSHRGAGLDAVLYEFSAPSMHVNRHLGPVSPR